MTYERTIGSATDFLHLRVDTTYREIGKGQFVYNIICDREIALQTLDGERFSDDQARLCFVDGATREWIKLEQRRSINGYDCKASVAAAEQGSWQAWYTTELPHCSAGAAIKDGLEGLILMVSGNNGEYALRAKHIDVKIG